MNMNTFGSVHYNAIGPWLKERFGERIVKLSLDGGFTCPNRDGTAGTGGCIFCSSSGSGDFAGTIPQQMKLLSRNFVLTIVKEKIFMLLVLELQVNLILNK